MSLVAQASTLHKLDALFAPFNGALATIVRCVDGTVVDMAVGFQHDDDWLPAATCEDTIFTPSGEL